jgi:hypothetical protein
MLDNGAKANLRLCSQAGRRAVSRRPTGARVHAFELSDFMARGWPDTLICLELNGETSLPASLGQLLALHIIRYDTHMISTTVFDDEELLFLSLFLSLLPLVNVHILLHSRLAVKTAGLPVGKGPDLLKLAHGRHAGAGTLNSPGANLTAPSLPICCSAL